MFGSTSQLLSLVEVYATEESQQKFVNDFVCAWNKVMNLDRFDLTWSYHVFLRQNEIWSQILALQEKNYKIYKNKKNILIWVCF